jgi:predicted ArsR family transcriptional regulator
MAKTQDKIRELLGEEPGLDGSTISSELGITYDTAMRHLKQMENNGDVIVKRRQAPPRYPGCEERRPWNNYYSLGKAKKTGQTML